MDLAIPAERHPGRVLRDEDLAIPERQQGRVFGAQNLALRAPHRGPQSNFETIVHLAKHVLKAVFGFYALPIIGMAFVAIKLVGVDSTKIKNIFDAQIRAIKFQDD